MVIVNHHRDIITGARDVLINFEKKFKGINTKEDYILTDQYIESNLKKMFYCHSLYSYEGKADIYLSPYKEDIYSFKIYPPIKKIKARPIGDKYILISDYYKNEAVAKNIIKNNPDIQFKSLTLQGSFFPKEFSNNILMERSEDLDSVFDGVYLILCLSTDDTWGLFPIECCGTGIPVAINEGYKNLPKFVKRTKIESLDNLILNGREVYDEYNRIAEEDFQRLVNKLNNI